MIGVDEALRYVLEAAGAGEPVPAEAVPLAAATGRVLRETVSADADMPPFTRSAMDGYAVRAADTAGAPVALEVVEEIPAGAAPRRRLAPGQASRIMTGAALPEGADAVQMVERTEPDQAGKVRILLPVSPGEHVRRQGEDLKCGAVLVESGVVLGPAHIGLLASCGRGVVSVSRRPRVAIIPTGDELVTIDRQPGPTQIRESNGHVLESLARLAGGEPDRRDITPDDAALLRRTIGAALAACDVLLLSGGVSMGDYDLVGAALLQLGCRPAFDRVAIQPGKPLWFGTWARPGGGDVLVFGLPGNPVSTLVDFLVFARPALRRLAGASSWLDATVAARLAEPLSRRGGRRAYLPASLADEQIGPTVRLLPSMGSADMVALARADALAIIPEEAERLEAGVRVRALPLAGLTRA